MINALRSYLNKDVIHHTSELLHTLQFKNTISDCDVTTVTITNAPKDALAITLDLRDGTYGELLPLCNLLNPAMRELHTRCDLVVLWQDVSQTKMVLFALQSVTDKPSDLQIKLDNSELLIKLLLRLANSQLEIDKETPIYVCKAVGITCEELLNNDSADNQYQQPINFTRIPLVVDPKGVATICFNQLSSCPDTSVQLDSSK